jgi:LacI family transcriptional regulator
VPDELIHFTPTTPDRGRELALNFFSRHPSATAAFIASEEVALGFLAGMQRTGRRAVRDFAIITYGGSSLHDFFDPPLSSYNYPNFIIGQKITELLLRSMAGEAPSSLVELVHAEFRDRGSQFVD